jgi:hypothetical protein
LSKLKIMVGKVIGILMVLFCFIMFIYSFGKENTNGLIFWGVLLLFNFISLNVNSIEERIDKNKSL